MAEADVGDDVYLKSHRKRLGSSRRPKSSAKKPLCLSQRLHGQPHCDKAWTHHGDEVICEERSHVNLYELASIQRSLAACRASPRGGRRKSSPGGKSKPSFVPKFITTRKPLRSPRKHHILAGGTL